MRLGPILMYHWFRAEGVSSESRSPQLEITPSLFAEQMEWLSRRGYRTISLARALGLEGGSTPDGREVVLTFDDGTLDFWERARPVLDSHGFTATLFVVSGHVGGHSTWDRHLGEPDRPLMSWEQIRELHAAGYEIGSHTHTHRSLTEVSDDEARDEFARSRSVLESRLGLAPRFVAYPRGQYTGRHKQLAHRSGYSGACAVILGWGDLWRGGRYELRRMTIKGPESMLRFRTKLALCRLVRYPDAGQGES